MTTSPAPCSDARQLSLADTGPSDGAAPSEIDAASLAHHAASLPDEAASVPGAASLSDLARAAVGCRACHLWEQATQTVFGTGTTNAAVMFVGEQPGDVEDREGAPFVGPTGRVLDQALEAAGIARELTYVTNVVKHFKWTARGKRRLHQSPNAAEQAACRPWLDAELVAVRPQVPVALGATAAKALLGRDFRVSRDRGRFVESSLAPRVLATVHPSSILRTDDEQRVAALQGLVDDLAVVADVLA